MKIRSVNTLHIYMTRCKILRSWLSHFSKNGSFLGTSLICNVIHQFSREFNGEFKKRKMNTKKCHQNDFFFIYRCVDWKMAIFGQFLAKILRKNKITGFNLINSSWYSNSFFPMIRLRSSLIFRGFEANLGSVTFFYGVQFFFSHIQILGVDLPRNHQKILCSTKKVIKMGLNIYH